MLTPLYLDVLPAPIVDMYDAYMQTVINDIARRLAKMPMTSSAAWQMQRLIESGAVYENAIKEIARLTGRSERELKELFKRAGVKSLAFDDKVYRMAGLSPLPLNMSPIMAQVLAAGLQKTAGVMRNLTMTTATVAQTQFIHAADIAYLQVSSGAMSYDQAIRAAINNVGQSGLWVTYPTGHRDRLDVAMRRTVLTGVAQTAGQLQWMRADELGQDLVQVSAHAGARPSHAEWQGKIYSRSGTDPDYPHFETATGYGTGAGLGGWNCRHSYYPFFKGISKNAYDEATRNEEDARTVTVGGKEMPLYDALQYQRSIERKIREWKRRAGAVEAGGLDSVFERGKVSQWQGRMRKFIKDSNLRREYIREKV